MFERAGRPNFSGSGNNKTTKLAENISEQALFGEKELNSVKEYCLNVRGVAERK